MREARISAYLLSPPLALLLSFPEFLLYSSDQRSLFLDSEHCSRIFFLFLWLNISFFMADMSICIFRYLMTSLSIHSSVYT